MEREGDVVGERDPDILACGGKGGGGGQQEIGVVAVDEGKRKEGEWSVWVLNRPKSPMSQATRHCC